MADRPPVANLCIGLSTAIQSGTAVSADELELILIQSICDAANDVVLVIRRISVSTIIEVVEQDESAG